MRDLLLELLEEGLDPEAVFDWVRRHRGALLLTAAGLLAALILLAPTSPPETADSPPLDLAPDDTPLFV